MFVTTGAVPTHEEQEMDQTLADDSAVVFDQPEESAGALEPEGSSRNRHKKEMWFEETEPHRGARPRKMDFNQLVDGELSATSERGGGRRYLSGGSIRGYGVSDATRAGRIAVGKRVFEDAEDRPAGSSTCKCSMPLYYRMDGVMRPRLCSYCHIYKMML